MGQFLQQTAPIASALNKDRMRHRSVVNEAYARLGY